MAGNFLGEGRLSRSMKKSFLCLFLVLGSTQLLTAVELTTSSAPSAYDQAVQSYIDAATKEMAAIRGQADGTVGSAPEDAVKQRFAKVYSQLDECDKLLAELKKATPADFDKIKLRFEQARTTAIKSLEAARKG